MADNVQFCLYLITFSLTFEIIHVRYLSANATTKLFGHKQKQYKNKKPHSNYDHNELNRAEAKTLITLKLPSLRPCHAILHRTFPLARLRLFYALLISSHYQLPTASSYSDYQAERLFLFGM
jgi:hypothetical protein